MMVRFTLQILGIMILIGCGDKTKTRLKEALSNNTLRQNIAIVVPDKVDNSLLFVVLGGGDKSYLMDKTGDHHFDWSFDHNLGNDLKLLSDGSVLGMFKSRETEFNFGGGYSGLTQIIDKQGSIVWEYRYASKDILSHHESIFLPNGNLVMLVWERVDSSAAIQNGADVLGDVFPEKIIELDTSSKSIVWEWNSWDHIVQDRYPDKPNYGILEESSSKISINYVKRKDGDIMHANGIEFDESRNVFFVSVNHYSEVWVIDHSTTSEEARTNRGGYYGKGGDLLYRFGNPATYNGEGSLSFDRMHNPNLIKDDFPGEGNLLVYSNGLKSKKSVVYELRIPEQFVDKEGYFVEPEIVWSFENLDLYYGRISGAYRLQNGNTLICEGDAGFWEVTPDKGVVWKYVDTSNTYWRAYPISIDDPVLAKLGISY